MQPIWEWSKGRLRARACASPGAEIRETRGLHIHGVQAVSSTTLLPSRKRTSVAMTLTECGLPVSRSVVQLAEALKAAA